MFRWQVPHTRRSYLQLSFLIVLLYGGLGLGYGWLIADRPEVAGYFWPAAGLGVSLLLLTGVEFWPAVLLAKLAGAAITQGGPFPLTAALGSTAELTLVALLLRSRIQREAPFERLSEVQALIAVTFVSVAGGALLVVGANWLFGFTPAGRVPADVLQWLRGDSLGMLVVVPLVLAWSTLRPIALTGALKGIGLLAATIAISYVIFATPVGGIGLNSPWSYVVFPLIIVAAIRFGQRGGVTTAFTAIVVAGWATFENMARPAEVNDWMMLWAFMAVLIITATAMAAALAEKQALALRLLHAEKMEAVGQLAAGVAHDFNNLLTVITGNSEEAALELGAGHPLAWRLEDIRVSADRAAGLTSQLLAFSRQEIAQPRVLSLNQSIAELQRMLAGLLGERIEMQVVLQPDAAPICADPMQVQQILLNLVVNARDAMPDGGRLLIETRTTDLDKAFTVTRPGSAVGPYVVLRVTDTGVGMSDDTRLRIFEPFFTTKEIGKGTGLGLATVYGVVKQAQGFIDVSSIVGRGTSFEIYFPAAQAAAV